MNGTVGSLFSGCGGLDLGLHYAGLEVAWACENDAAARSIFQRHWPAIPVAEDVREIDAGFPAVDVLAGGFPCQDLSQAGLRAGLAVGTRSGLWFSFADAIRVLRPRVVIVENVPGLLTAGFGIVAADLAALGYVGRWCCFRASDLGAPHGRLRIFIVATTTDFATAGPDHRHGVGGGTVRGRGIHLQPGEDQAAPEDHARIGDYGRRCSSTLPAHSGDRQDRRTIRTEGSGQETVLAMDSVRRCPCVASTDAVLGRTRGQETCYCLGGARACDCWPDGLSAGDRYIVATDAERLRVDTDGRVLGGGAGVADRPPQAALPPREEVACPADAGSDGWRSLADTDGGRREQRDAGVGRLSVPGPGGEQAAADSGGDRLVRFPTVDGADGGVDLQPWHLADGRDLGDAGTRDGHEGEPAADVGGSRSQREEREGSEPLGQREAADGSGEAAGGPRRPVADWGVYAAAVEYWEELTRVAPRPTDDRGRLNPAFVEWMLGFPDGWTDGASRTQRLKMLGNAVQVQAGELVGIAVGELL